MSDSDPTQAHEAARTGRLVRHPSQYMGYDTLSLIDHHETRIPILTFYNATPLDDEVLNRMVLAYNVVRNWSNDNLRQVVEGTAHIAWVSFENVEITDASNAST